MKDIRQGRVRLADGIVEQMREDIRAGRLSPGEKLPTEPQFMERFSVSRTVIREAVAELRAEGLVRTVQGAGAFVTEADSGFRLALTQDEASSIPRTLEMLEFRVGFEAEAAALAALRAGPADEHEIRISQELLTLQVERGEPSAEADFRFHLAIAEAAHSALYVQAMQSFGPDVIPRSHLPSQPRAQSKDYIELVISEHEQIREAIGRSDPDGARLAMRTHLDNSRTRYRSMAREAGLKSMNARD